MCKFVYAVLRCSVIYLWFFNPFLWPFEFAESMCKAKKQTNIHLQAHLQCEAITQGVREIRRRQSNCSYEAWLVSRTAVVIMWLVCVSFREESKAEASQNRRTQKENKNKGTIDIYFLKSRPCAQSRQCLFLLEVLGQEMLCRSCAGPVVTAAGCLTWEKPQTL